MTAMVLQKKLFSDKSLSFVASAVIHAAVIFAGLSLISKPVEYGIDTGSGGIEVSMIAAPALEIAPAPVQQAVEIKVPAPVVQPEKSEMVMPKEEVAPQPVVAKPAPLQKAKVLTQDASKALGDGSSATPGKDKATFFSKSGASMDSKPGYLKNPAPAYPVEAKRLGQEGLVILSVKVSSSGAPLDVVLKQSAGYSLLDEAALKAVRRWKFQAARIGSFAVESQAEVPVRFRLKG